MENRTFQSRLKVLEIAMRNKPTLLLRAYNNAKTAVLVVDMCIGFCRVGALSSPMIDKIVPNIATVLDYLPNAHKIMVIDKHTESSVELSSYPIHCHNDKECALVPELIPFADETVFKNSTNGIFSLLDSVSLTDFENILIMGCCTDICILQLSTAVKAMFNEGNIKANVIVPTDCVATYDSDDHDARLLETTALKIMELGGVTVCRKLV